VFVCARVRARAHDGNRWKVLEMFVTGRVRFLHKGNADIRDTTHIVKVKAVVIS